MKRLTLSASVVALLVASALPASAIISGEPDDGEHPYVGLLVFDTEDGPAWRCSGSLLSERVVLTAGHCTDGAVQARIWMDEDVEDNDEYPSPGGSSTEGTPHTIDSYCPLCHSSLHGFLHRDIGVVVLDEPVRLDRYAQLPEIGVVDEMPNRARATVVGYGVQERLRGGGQPQWHGELTRMKADAEKVSGNHQHSDEVLRLSHEHSHGKGGTCFGDSGGPALVKGSDVVIGVTSYGPNWECTGPGYYSRTDIQAVQDWIDDWLTSSESSTTEKRRPARR